MFSRNIIYLISISIISLFVGCVNETKNLSDDLSPFEHSMKGYEIYYWNENSDLWFTIITGTNRNKTIDEIKSRENKNENGFVKVTVKGKDELKVQVKRIPKDDYLFFAQIPGTLEFSDELKQEILGYRN